MAEWFPGQAFFFLIVLVRAFALPDFVFYMVAEQAVPKCEFYVQSNQYFPI